VAVVYNAYARNGMLRLIESSIAAIERQLVLVAPGPASCINGFANVTNDAARKRALIHEMQRLRGSIYLDEGNVTHHELTADGRHQTAEDDKSWHLLMTDDHGRVRSCVLYLEHDNVVSMGDLRLRECPLVTSPASRGRVTAAVESEIGRARHDGLRFGELGGWAITRERRCTPDGLMMTLAVYALCRMRGGALCITTANVAHSCSSILRRVGGSYIEFEGTPIPSYFDPRYNTDIDLLRFDSRYPSPKYAGLVSIIAGKLANVSVVGGSLDTLVDRLSPADVAQPGRAA
jgi:hypothetical protein